MTPDSQLYHPNMCQCKISRATFEVCYAWDWTWCKRNWLHLRCHLAAQVLPELAGQFLTRNIHQAPHLSQAHTYINVYLLQSEMV